MIIRRTYENIISMTIVKHRNNNQNHKKVIENQKKIIQQHTKVIDTR